MDEDSDNKARIKSAHFNDSSIATVIPASKTYNQDKHGRKDAEEAYYSKRGTYALAIIIGAVVIVIGGVLIWVGSHFNLKDFFVLGPLVLCIGLGLAAGGIVFLCLSLRKTRQANTRVANGSSGRDLDTPAPMLSDYSFVTTSDVTMNVAHGSRPGTVDLYVNTDSELAETSKDSSNIMHESPTHDELYPTSNNLDVMEAAVVSHRTSTPSSESRHHQVSTPEGVYAISLPNETLRSDGDGSSQCETGDDSMISDSSVPKPAVYYEPDTNKRSDITSL